MDFLGLPIIPNSQRSDNSEKVMHQPPCLIHSIQALFIGGTFPLLQPSPNAVIDHLTSYWEHGSN